MKANELIEQSKDKLVNTVNEIIENKLPLHMVSTLLKSVDENVNQLIIDQLEKSLSEKPVKKEREEK